MGTSKGKEAAKEKLVFEEWWSRNPNPVTKWKILDRMTLAFANFFQFNQELLKANTMGWSRLKTHDPRKKGKKTSL